MARPKGSRDRDYDARRHALVAAARAHLSTPGARHASWRDLAAACGVSVSTMNHYFAGRSALIAAIAEVAEAEGRPYLEIAATPSGDLATSVGDLCLMLSRGFDHGVLALQVIGLGEGFADPQAAGAYLAHNLEPTLGAIARRLETHMRLGEMRQANARHAAIQLLSPLLVAHLHQQALGGQGAYPLSLPAFVEQHAQAFVRAYAAPADAMPVAPPAAPSAGP